MGPVRFMSIRERDSEHLVSGGLQDYPIKFGSMRSGRGPRL